MLRSSIRTKLEEPLRGLVPQISILRIQVRATAAFKTQMLRRPAENIAKATVWLCVRLKECAHTEITESGISRMGRIPGDHESTTAIDHRVLSRPDVQLP